MNSPASENLIKTGWWWLEPWNFMTFHWEFHHPNWSELHHFSEGLVYHQSVLILFLMDFKMVNFPFFQMELEWISWIAIYNCGYIRKGFHLSFCGKWVECTEWYQIGDLTRWNTWSCGNFGPWTKTPIEKQWKTYELLDAPNGGFKNWENNKSCSVNPRYNPPFYGSY